MDLSAYNYIFLVYNHHHTARKNQILRNEKNMSVTIFPSNNLEYCRTNSLETVVEENCGCDRGCEYCNGTGVWKVMNYPFELNLSNDNFSTFF